MSDRAPNLEPIQGELMTLLIVPIATLLSASTLTADDPSAAGAAAISATPATASTWLPSSIDDDSSPWYWSLGGSFVTTRSSDGPSEEIDFDEGWGAQVAFGHRHYGSEKRSLMFDLEVEGLYTDQEPDRDDGPFEDLNTAAIMLNALGALPVGERAEVFFGGGLGLGWLDIGSSSDGLNSFDDEDGPFFAWQLRAGLRFDVAATTQLEVGYRFMNIDDAQIDDGIGDSDFDLETEQHSLGLSVRFGV
jgi:opacity protein-like surface antigen